MIGPVNSKKAGKLSKSGPEFDKDGRQTIQKRSVKQQNKPVNRPKWVYRTRSSQDIDSNWPGNCQNKP